MKVYKKIILDRNNKIIYEDSFEYNGKWSYAGIHYTRKAFSGQIQMEKKAKKEQRRAEKRAKKQSKQGTNKSEDKTIPIDQVVTLEHLTNPEKK